MVIPLDQFSENGKQFAGAAAFRIDPAGAIEAPVQLSHDDSGGAVIRRSLVLGDRLFTVSARGVMAHDLATLESEGFADFGTG